MIEAGAGLSMSEDTAAAARAATDAALGRLGRGSADVAVLFATASHADGLQAAARHVRQRAGVPVLLGCTGAGVMTLDADVEGGAGLAVLLVRGGDGIRPLAHMEEADTGIVGGRRAGRALREAEEPRVVILLPDASSFRAGPFLAGLELEMPGVPVVGAASTDDGTGRRSRQLAGDAVATGAVAALALGGALAPTVQVAQSCFAASEPLRVTGATGNLLLELEGRSAFEAFVAFADARLEGDLRRVMEVGTSVAVSTDEGAGAADYFVRQIVGVDPEQRMLALSEGVEEGQRVAFALRTSSDAWKSMQTDLQVLRRRRDGARPACGIYFAGAGRMSGFFGMPSLDTSLIRAALGDFPLVGIYGAAEIAPLAGRSRLNLFSGVLLLVDSR